MYIQSLSAANFRNLKTIKLPLSSGFNFLYGDNGAGKTSILEAIHVLSTGQSFRKSRIKDLITYDHESLIVSAEINHQDITIHQGIKRTADSIQARINQKNVQSIVELTENLPVIAVYPETFRLLIGEPSERRAFLDWGLFYLNHHFLLDWKKYRRALEQRNVALKSKQPKATIKQWDEILSTHGERIGQAREDYLDQLSQVLPQFSENLKIKNDITWRYRQGWPSDKQLLEVLNSTIDRDIQQGFTFSGPHRGDFSLFFNKHEVAKFASRGQTKQITLLLKLAQAHLHIKQNQTKCLLLLDDLPSELDKDHLHSILESVEKLNLQVVVTAVEPILMTKKNQNKHRVFHVEHGSVNRITS